MGRGKNSTAGAWILRIGLLGILHHNYIKWTPPRIVLVVI